MMKTTLTIDGNEISCDGHLRVAIRMENKAIKKLMIYGLTEEDQIDMTIDVLELPNFYPSLAGDKNGD
jgi:hypothetical protein